MVKIEYRIGIDGGGTGTRARLSDAAGHPLAIGRAGPSALINGAAAAWQAIEAAIVDAYAAARLPRPGRQTIGLGIGLAGANHPRWATDFMAADPGYGVLALDSDGYTTLLGAHGGAPGAVVAVGTGSIGLALDPDGRRRVVGGWGFPSGDEGSGAWLGLRAAAHLQQVFDGRAAASAFSQALTLCCGANGAQLLEWLGAAQQAAYASLAPLVISNAASDDVARRLVEAAALEVARLAEALDPEGRWPLSLCGGLAEPLRAWLPAALRARETPAQGDAAQGALLLLARRLGPFAADKDRA